MVGSLIGGVITLFSISNNLKIRHQARALVKENILLNKKLGYLKEQIEELKQRAKELAEFDAKLRVAWAMDLVPKEVRLMGVGGPSNFPTERQESGIDFLAVEKTIDELSRQLQYQRQSYLEIEAYLKQQEDVLNHTPSIWPVRGWVSSGFGKRRDPFTGRYVMHNGIDIVAPPGTPVVAPADGRVCFASVKPGFGKVIEIDHGYGYVTFYGHCQSIRKTYGETVRRGEIIAYVGRSGKSTGYHLHYGVKVSGVWVNPLNYILDNYATAD